MGTFLLVLALLGVVFLFLEAFHVSTPWFSFGWLGWAILAVVWLFVSGVVSGA